MKQPTYIVCWKDSGGKDDKDTATRYNLDGVKTRVEMMNKLYECWGFSFWYELAK